MSITVLMANTLLVVSSFVSFFYSIVVPATLFFLGICHFQQRANVYSAHIKWAIWVESDVLPKLDNTNVTWLDQVRDAVKLYVIQLWYIDLT